LTLPLPRDRRPFPYLPTLVSEAHGHFSPDAHWVVDESDETGRPHQTATKTDLVPAMNGRSDFRIY
jgi:hypothetical protein